MNDDQDKQLGEAIRRHATRHAAPDALRDRLAARLQQAAQQDVTQQQATRQTAAAGRQSGRSWNFWKPWTQIAAAFASGVVAASLVVVAAFPPVGEQDRMEQEVVDSHVRSLMVAHLADVASTDQHTVKPWFTGKLDFSPPVRDLAKEGFPLVGGRLDYLDQRQVAALVYGYKRHTINVFVWPAKAGAKPVAKPLSRQGFNIVSWADAGMQFWAVSDLNAEQLQGFAALLRTQP